jgi:hypothetical protein
MDQLTFKEMGLLSWLIVDVAIQWGGWVGVPRAFMPSTVVPHHPASFSNQSSQPATNPATWTQLSLLVPYVKVQHS